MSETQPARAKTQTTRRRLMIGTGLAAAAAAWWGWPKVAPYFVGEFTFEALPGMPGFRQISAGETSGNINPLAGIDQTAQDNRADFRNHVRTNICEALFGDTAKTGVVPIASFSDYYCPFCRALTQKLAALEQAANGRVRITWHEWPLLGSNSDLAARAALAADRQGAYVAFHKRLMRTSFVATPEFLEALAKGIGIKSAQMLADIESDVVSRRLQSSAAIAEVLGFRGTPALVVGRTVVVGAVSDATLKALIDQERRDGPLPFCEA